MHARARALLYTRAAHAFNPRVHTRTVLGLVRDECMAHQRCYLLSGQSGALLAILGMDTLPLRPCSPSPLGDVGPPHALRWLGRPCSS